MNKHIKQFGKEAKSLIGTGLIVTVGASAMGGLGADSGSISAVGNIIALSTRNF